MKNFVLTMAGATKEITRKIDAKKKQNFKALAKQDTRELGNKSIYFDPELNPKGIAPTGYTNYYYPLKYPQYYEIDDAILSIPVPKGPPPKYFNMKNQVVFASEEAMVQPMVPTNLRKRTKPLAKKDKRVKLQDVTDEE